MNLCRYTSTGSIDGTFGSSGKVIMRFTNSQAEIKAMKIQSDDKILVAGRIGYVNDSGVLVKIVLARYSTNGSLDNSFGTGGIVNIALLNQKCYLTCMALQQDGKILVAGIRKNDQNEDTSAFVARFLSSGFLDSSFSSDGIVPESFPFSIKINAIVVQADGKIIIGGNYKYDFQNAFVLVRYTSSGSKDINFGTNGTSIVQMGSTARSSGLNDLALQSDGKILAAGSVEGSSTEDFTLVRYKSVGTIDSTFGVNGISKIAFSSTYSVLTSVIIQTDGKIIASGHSQDNASTYCKFAVGRYQTNGKLDSTFAINGYQINSVGAFNASYDAFLQPDGKILLAGGGGSDHTFVLARYNGNASFLRSKKNIASLSMNEILIFPNPSKNIITISGLNADVAAEVFLSDIQGKILNRVVVKGYATTINISKLTDGIYFVNIKQRQSTIVKKFVKN